MASNGNWLERAGKAVLHGIEKLPAFLASPAGQELEKTTEAAIDISFPPAAPVVAIVDSWLNKIAVVEGKAEAAADLGAKASSEQKAAAAIVSVTPDVEKILEQYKLLPLSADQYKAINDAVVVIANQLKLAPAAPAAA